MKFNIFKFQNIAFKILTEIFIFNKDKRAQLKSRWAKKYLQKYVDVAFKEQFEPAKEGQKVIWQYWHQGLDGAPEVIKKCLNSVKRVENDKEIRVLTFDTIKNWVELPQKYYDMVNSKKMPIALFSDILRVYLLEKYGGTWIDSTIYLTDKIPSDIFEADFFQYFFPDNIKSFTGNKNPCYFIHAKANSANIQAIKKILNAYWAENDFMFNYFMFEYIETMLRTSENPQIKAEWDKMPIHFIQGGSLRAKLYEKFNQEEWDKIIERTYFHKLTYKKMKSQKVDKTEDNFLKHL